MALDQSNLIWIGCQHGRIIQYDRKLKKSSFSTPAVFSGQTVRTVKVDATNRLWFGTQGGKLVSYFKGVFKLEANFNAIISTLYFDKKGALWIGTSGKGLIKYDVGKHAVETSFLNKEEGNSISSNRITDVVQLNDTLMAIACDANLDMLNLASGKIRNMNPYSGLEQNIVSALEVDRNGFLWMSSSGGIGRLDPRTLRVRYYDQKDGMVNTATQANLMHISHHFANGDLFFAGDKNFMIFNPDSLNRRFVPKDVLITGFRVFDDYIPIAKLEKDGVIRLRSDQNVFTVQFSSLSYKQTRQLKYFYRLEGSSEKWIQVENGQSASFASLSPGKYNFMVYAVNLEGIRSPKVTSLFIEIVPEFYQTRLFLFMIVVACLIPVVIIYRLRTRRRREVYLLREKVARDLHDEMGSTLTSISILSEVAKRGLSHQHTDTLEYLGKISENSTQMMESMDDIVWSIKPDNDQLSKIIVRMREHTTQILELQGIEYDFVADEQMRHAVLPMDSRRNLFLIYKEALNNISKYASASHVVIDIRCSFREMVLTVTDNGKGFDTRILSEGNGLMNMRKRAELMKGSLDLESVIGEGTKLTLRIPI